MISRYAFKAMTTWGEVADYKYFLPRILELCANGESGAWPGLDTWLIASKLQLAHWGEWPEAEQLAVRGAFRGGWRAALSKPPEKHEAVEFLHGLAEVEDIAPFLDFWAIETSTTSSRQLAYAAHWYWNEIAKTGTVWSAWKAGASARLQRNAAAFAQWLRTADRRERLLSEFEMNSEEPWATDVAEACDELEWLSQALGA